MLERIKAIKIAAAGDFAALAEEAGFRHVRSKTWRCALHRDRTPSVHEYPQALYCFSCAQHFDVVDLGALAHGNIRTGLQALAQRYGVTPGKAPKRINPVVLERAERFRTGFRWALERHLANLKTVLMAEDEPDATLAEGVLGYTRLLVDLDRWGARDLVSFYSQMRKRKPGFVSACIQEVRESEFSLAAALGGGAA